MVKPRAYKKAEKATKIIPGPSDRRRGRPIGKNRVPLSIDERRARNALYEQERRNEIADAFSELAEAVSVDSNMPQTELLASVLCFLKQRTENSEANEAEDLARQNATLEWQVQKLTGELAQYEHEAGGQDETSPEEAAVSLEAFTPDQINYICSIIESQSTQNYR